MTLVRPEFIRLPAPKTNCPHTGFSRTGLYNLTVPCRANGNRPAVPAKCLRQPGNLRGIWLIPYEALIAHLNSLPTPGLVAAAEKSPQPRKARGSKTAAA